MAKYLIIPRDPVVFEVHTRNAEDAMDVFAFQFDTDLNTYFKAVTEKEYEEIKISKRIEERKQDYIDWATDEILSMNLEEDKEEITEDEAREFAELAWEYYTGEIRGGDGLTKYECIELALEDRE